MSLRIFNYLGRAAKVWDVAVIGDGSKVLEKAYAKGLNGHRNIFSGDFYTNFWQTTKTAGKELEAYKAAEVAKNGSTWKVLGNNFRNIPTQFKHGWKVGERYAKIHGKNALLSKMRGALKFGGKTLGRVAGPALLLAFEVPNIFRATKDEGIASGLIETGKAAAKLGGFVGGAAIGQALIPIPVVGGLIGGILGDILVSKIVGKSYTEKKEARQAEIAKVMQQQQHQNNPSAQIPFTGAQEQAVTQAQAPVQNPATVNPLQQQQNLALMQQMMARDNFSDDFMLQSNGGKVNLFA